MSGSDVLHVGDYGTRLTFTVVDRDGDVVDISTATTITVLMMKPDRTIASKTGLLLNTGTDGKLYYDLVDGDLDVEGDWNFKAEVTSSSPSFHYESSSCEERVYARWT